MQDALNVTEKLPQLFNESFKVLIPPLVIYGLRGIHTYTHTFVDKSDFKKPGARLHGLKIVYVH